jgi:putative glutamine amidotransferase
MPRPIIGITVRQIPARETKGRLDTARSYVDEIERAGGVARLIAPNQNLRSEIGKIDGLLLPGGGDVYPKLYGANPDGSEPPDNARDRMEIEAIRLALNRRMPILGICRGIQVLNVALGGDLIQHIPKLNRGKSRFLQHCDPKNRLSHNIRVEAGSLLARLIRAKRPKVNSRHHQAVGERLGEGLRVTARSSDGIVEAIEMDKSRLVLGVQFHPENLVANYPRHGGIFKWLIAEATRYRRRF